MNNVLYNVVMILKKDLLNRFGKYVWHVNGRYRDEENTYEIKITCVKCTLLDENITIRQKIKKYVEELYGLDSSNSRYSEEDEAALGVTVRVLKWDITADKLEEIGMLYRMKGYQYEKA